MKKLQKNLKNMTVKELENWKLSLEMTDTPMAYLNSYKDTIKAIQAELDKRNNKKVRHSKPRKFQEIAMKNFTWEDEKGAKELLEATTVKAINAFLKTTGLKVKRSLRKAEKIAAIVEIVMSIKAMDVTEKFELLKAGTIDKLSILNLCSIFNIIDIAKMLNLHVDTFNIEILISEILAA